MNERIPTNKINQITLKRKIILTWQLKEIEVQEQSKGSVNPDHVLDQTS